ncbi:IclR family transcriptional regulator [Pacificimonas sp. ICDLI1SI03]
MATLYGSAAKTQGGRIFAAGTQDSYPVVKSAARVLRILEFFDDVRRPASTAEIAAFCGFPQSSTSQLLRSLLGSGYLDFDRETRCYRPSMRVSLLGSWCHDLVVHEGSLPATMKRLNQRTGRAIFLASQVGPHANYVLVYQSTIAGRPHLTLGTSRQISTSGAGLALMSMMSDSEATSLVLRNNAERGKSTPNASLHDVMAHLRQIRQEGYISYIDEALSGGILAAPLSPRPGHPRLAICLGDHMDSFLQDHEHLQAIFIEELSRYEGTAADHPVEFEDLASFSATTS